MFGRILICQLTTYMFLLAGNIMPGAEKLQEELLIPKEKQVSCRNQMFSEQFSTQCIMFQPIEYIFLYFVCNFLVTQYKILSCSSNSCQTKAARCATTDLRALAPVIAHTRKRDNDGLEGCLHHHKAISCIFSKILSTK